ncbi:MAG: DUF2877 domain-containing protein [Nitriliruptoraceae bacterium]
MIPVVAALPLRELLDGPQRVVTVLARFPHAAYLQLAIDAEPAPVIALVTSDGIAHPNSLVLTRPAAARPLASVHRGEAAMIGDGALWLGGEQYRPVRWWSPVPALASVDADMLAVTSSLLGSHLDVRSQALPQELGYPLRSVQEALTAGRVRPAAAAARDLVGRGPGLTPAGDDVLAGLLAAGSALSAVVAPTVPEVRRAIDEFGAATVADAVGRTTAISLELLRQAAADAVLAPAGRLLRALVHTDDLSGGRIVVAADELLAVGSTSGRDLAVGLHAGAALVAGAATGVVPGPSRRSIAAVPAGAVA